MEQLTKNQAVATSQEAVQNQNEPQLRDENAHNDKSVHGVLNPTYQAGLRRDAVQPDIEAERKKRDEIEAGKSYCSRRFGGATCDDKSAQIYARFDKNDWRIQPAEFYRFHDAEVNTFNLFNNLIQRNQSAAFSSGKVRPNHETNINIIARRTGKDVNSHTVLDGIITTIMATIQRINIIGSREGSRNRRRLKANQTGKKFRVGIKSNISTNRNNLISGVDRCIHLNAMKKTTITSINRQTIKI